MDAPHWIDVASLTNYEVAPDGSSVKLNVLDAEGKDASVIVPMDALTTLALSMPKIVFHAMRYASGGAGGPRLTHDVAHWKIERSADPSQAILTLMTPDQFEISFAVNDGTLAQMAELLDEFRVEAFPKDLQLH